MGGGLLTLRRRGFATTYASFSPDGRRLLANVGGEQVYLFDLTEPKRTSLLASGANLGRKEDGDSGEGSKMES